jgi:hypothetical protein
VSTTCFPNFQLRFDQSRKFFRIAHPDQFFTHLQQSTTTEQQQMDYHQELKAVAKKIEELKNSEVYKTLAKKNRVWAVPKPTEEEKGEWGLLKEELFELEKDK